MNSILYSKFKRSLHVGVSGSKTMAFNIVSLMWLRTVMNYQYRYGTSFPNTIAILYREGGIRRFYSGMTYALLEAPLIKFFDTFSNSIVLSLTSSSSIPIFLRTILSSCMASSVKALLAPLDTVKTMYQVHGKEAPKMIKEKINQYGIKCLYHGFSASILAGIISHYPWFVTHNYLEEILPKNKIKNRFIRNAFIGFTSSSVASVTSNFIRVIKTSRQTSLIDRSYVKVAEKIRMKSGLRGLLFRGLAVRLVSNGIQGLCFNVIWKYLQDRNEIKRKKN